jgi:hypothetical protein
MRAAYAEIKHLPRTCPEGQWGGWSIQSSTGEYSDGWASGQHQFKGTANGIVKIASNIEGANKYLHKNFTEAAMPEFRNCIKQASKLGLHPLRSRVIELRPDEQSGWHVDSDKLEYRLHFVIQSNPKAVMLTEQGEFHLAQDNVFIFNINEYHQVRNFGDDHRVHLMMDVNVFIADRIIRGV